MIRHFCFANSIYFCMLFILASIQPVCTHAQTSRHEISFGGGPSLGVVGESNLKLERKGYKKHHFTPWVFSLCYNYNINKHIAVGCMMRYNREVEGLDDWGKESLQRINKALDKHEYVMLTRDPAPISTDEMTYDELIRTRENLLSNDNGAKNVRLAIVPSVRLYWFNNKAFGMYSKLGAGMLFTIGDKCSSDNRRVHFAFYGAPIGMEGGNDVVRGYLEISLGLEAGIKINLPFKWNDIKL